MERGVAVMTSSLILAAVLLMLVAVLVLVLVLLEGSKKKRKKLAEEVGVRSTLKPSAVPAGDRHTVKQAVENPDSICIYAYTPRKPVRRCSACDGENPVSCSRCMICGCEMSPMGR